MSLRKACELKWRVETPRGVDFVLEIELKVVDLKVDLKSMRLVNLKIFDPKTHQLGGFDGGDKTGLVVDAQLGGLTQTTTTNTCKKAQNTEQPTKVWLK